LGFCLLERVLGVFWGVPAFNHAIDGKEVAGISGTHSFFFFFLLLHITSQWFIGHLEEGGSVEYYIRLRVVFGTEKNIKSPAIM